MVIGTHGRTSPARELGAAAVEFALIAPILLGLIFGVIDFSMAFVQKNQLNQGAAAAAREYTIALANGDSQSAAKAAATTSFTTQSGFAQDSVAFTWSCSGSTCAASDACPASLSSAPPTIVLTATMARRSLTGAFSSIMTEVSGEGVALCQYSS